MVSVFGMQVAPGATFLPKTFGGAAIPPFVNQFTARLPPRRENNRHGQDLHIGSWRGRSGSNGRRPVWPLHLGSGAAVQRRQARDRPSTRERLGGARASDRLSLRRGPNLIPTAAEGGDAVEAGPHLGITPRSRGLLAAR